MDEITKNTGVIEGQRATDYVAGTLPYEVLNPTGDWTKFLPVAEWQVYNGFDLMACVTFSALNVIETLYYHHTGEQRNFSDRFTAFMSGTTPAGNFLWKVGDSIRKDGLVDETDWPAIFHPTWDQYYSVPPIEIINKAKIFKSQWKVNYEFVEPTRDSLIHHLKQSPIQVVFPNHAVMNFYTNEQVYKIFDTYDPFIKERTVGFTSALKYVMTKNNMIRYVRADKDVWLVKDNQRSLIYNALAFTIIDGDWTKIETINQSELDAIPDSGKVLAGIEQE